jgi:hypothetical protein
MSVFGETLKQARSSKGVTVKEAEQATRINRLHLAALEEENFTALPPLIRGGAGRRNRADQRRTVGAARRYAPAVGSQLCRAGIPGGDERGRLHLVL